MAISSIGVGSGLPLDQLLADLEAAERAPLGLIEDRQTLTESRISAYGLLKSAMEKLQSAGTKLADSATFSATKASVTGDALTAASNGSAIAGNYSIEVQQLATHQMMVAQGQADRDVGIGTGGIIKVTLADGTVAELDLSGKNTSLDGLMDAINESDLGIQATILNDGDPDAPYRLMLSAAGSGEAASVTSISVEGNAGLTDLLGYDSADPGASNMDVTAATDARLTINGIEITSGSNTVQDVIEGVTLTLETTTTQPAMLKIAKDTSVARTAIQGFVDAYNSLQGTIKNLTAYNADDQTRSVLTGDSVARSVQASARQIVDVSLGGADIATLAQLSITTDPTTGQLKVDGEALDKALSDHPQAVSDLFAGESGVAARIASVADPILRSGGVIATATAGMQATLEDLQEQYDSAEERIASTMERYRQQFIQLDSMVAQMNSLSTYLTQQLSMLGNTGKQDK